MSSKISVVVDTNLLLLYFVGLTNLNNISRFSRTSKYTDTDFVLLKEFIAKKQLIITQTILTEISNLSSKEYIQSDINRIIFECIKYAIEYSSTCKIITNINSFNKFGFADASIEEIAKNNILILTDDLDLFGYLSNSGYKTINFNHIKSK